MGSLAKAIEPKSDQLNSDDLITGPVTVKVTGVNINETAEQKVVIHYEGDSGKPYKPCKGMTRVMAEIWGGADNGQSFIGQSMTATELDELLAIDDVKKKVEYLESKRPELAKEVNARLEIARKVFGGDA